MDEWKPCPVEGCQRQCRRTHAMCAAHWSTVPKELQRQLYAAFRRWRADLGNGDLFRDYREVLNACCVEAAR